MKIMYMGTPHFASVVLENMVKALPESEFCVVTKPDTPKGRSYKLVPCETAKKAEELGLVTYKPENLREENFRDILEKESPDVIVVAAYGKILPEYVLNYPKYSCLNVHGSLLPEYRGAAPVNRAIMDGKTVTGVTIMKMEKGLDTGEMFLKGEVEIDDNTTATDLFERLAHVGSELMLKALEMAENGTLKGEKQDDALSNYAEKITDADMKIDWTASSREIARKIHGLSDEPGAYTKIKSSDKLLKIYRVQLGEYCDDTTPGEVVLAKKKIQVACGEGSLYLLELQAQGGKRLSGADFANGRGVSVGDILE
ncbi:MAG: methionyl-tRNA formyltransferase [Clostridia bacterium]|nr:methionyl-tRNA formyltransferase [Clostridia bacterium]